MIRLKYSTDHGHAPQHLWYFPVHPAPGRKAHDTMSKQTGGQHSPPRVKLFANGMSKWTGAIFGILDVLLSMPKKKKITHGTARVSETGKFIGTTGQEGDESPANKKTNRTRRFRLGGGTTNNTNPSVRVCVFTG